VARYHTRARQPSHWAAAVEIRLRHRHGLPARCSDTIRNPSGERALGQRPNKSRPGTEPQDRTRVAHIPYCEADRNFSASSTNANIGPAPHGDKQRRRCGWPASTTPHGPLSQARDRDTRPMPCTSGLPSVFVRFKRDREGARAHRRNRRDRADCFVSLFDVDQPMTPTANDSVNSRYVHEPPTPRTPTRIAGAPLSRVVGHTPRCDSRRLCATHWLG
jgi:hypothetical protein